MGGIPGKGMQVMSAKNAYIIAGPNGSGKTTFARQFLPHYAVCTNFVNADLIALGLSPFAPASAAISAGKLVIRQINDYVARGADFAFETTLAGRAYVGLLAELRDKGYRVNMYFLWLPSPELSIARIRERVREGGHDVPSDDVRRRYVRGISNFLDIYEPMLDSWMLFDNSGTKPILIAKRTNGKREVLLPVLFEKIRK